MKERELRAHAKCDLCQSLIGASGLPLFWTLRLQQHGIKMEAVTRQTGLAMQLSPSLAMIMGPDEEMTQTLTDVQVTVCATCALEKGDALIHRMAEIATARDGQIASKAAKA